ncbi:MAG: dihydrofolate reductase [Deltaproteobacteria bacterium]|nr:MAG: dihydrofolate reductase [Deltaproteobacteria bacterium]
MKLSIIAAVSENGVIGIDGRLPWHLPADQAFFKRATIGHAVIMGRRTFESIQGPLPKRTTIVVTRNRAYRAPGAVVVEDLDAALAAAAGDDEVFVAGGAELYREALPRADRLYLTVVHTDVAGDVFFPEVDFSAWRLVDEVRHEADVRHAHAFTIRSYAARRAATGENAPERNDT